MEGTSGSTGDITVTEDQVAQLKIAAGELSAALKNIDARITDLTERIESLGGGGREPKPAAQAPVEPSGEPAGSKTGADGLSTFVIRVEPLRELAMAAMAETALRDLPSVEQVLSVERADDWANFILEVKSGADLVEEMKLVLPVHFKVTDSGPGRMSIALAWAWGEPESQD